MKVKILKAVRVLTPAGTVLDVNDATAKWLIGVKAAEIVLEKAPTKKTENTKTKK